MSGYFFHSITPKPFPPLVVACCVVIMETCVIILVQGWWKQLMSWERLHVWALITLVGEFGTRGCFLSLPGLWSRLSANQRCPHCEECCVGMIAALCVLIECMKTLGKWTEAATGDTSANHSPWVRSRCGLRSWLHVVMIVLLFISCTQSWPSIKLDSPKRHLSLATVGWWWFMITVLNTLKDVYS